VCCAGCAARLLRKQPAEYPAVPSQLVAGLGVKADVEGLPEVVGAAVSERLRRVVPWGAAAVGAALILGGCEIPGPYTEFTVNTTVDGGDAAIDGVCEMTIGAGDCSLRAAIDEGNATIGDPPRIVVPAGTYLLTEAGVENENARGDLDIDPVGNRMILDGDDAVIDANGGDRAMDVHRGLALIDGVALRDAAGAGLRVRTSSIADVTAASIHHNGGPGIAVDAGGALFTTNTTSSTNGGAGIANAGTYVAVYTTITVNAGGVTGTGTTHLRASILADQTSGANCTTAAVSRDWNVADDASCGLTAAHDQQSTEPLLDTISSHPLPGHPLLVGSPATDSIPDGTPELCDGTLSHDQEHHLRLQGIACNAGALETPAGLDLVVDNPADLHDTTPSDGYCDIDMPPVDPGDCTLRAAIDEANAWPADDTIRLAVDPALAIPGTNDNANATGDLDITDGLTLVGDGHTIDANDLDRVLHVSGSPVELDDVTITDGRSTGTGGGGLRLEGGILRITDSTVTANVATEPGGNGGGIYLAGGAVTIEGSTFTDNTAAHQGGGLHQAAGFAVMTESSVRGNHAHVGGGLRSVGVFTVERSVVEDNTVTRSGGGISNDGDATVDRSIIAGNAITDPNQSDPLGGGIEHEGPSLQVRDTTIDGNEGDIGSGVYITTGVVVIERSTLSNNVGWEGALFLDSADDGVLVANSTISGNSGAEGGGVHLWDSSIEIIGSTIAGNTVSEVSEGAALQVNEGGEVDHEIVMTGTIITGPGPDCDIDEIDPLMQSGGYNIGSDSSCALTHATDLQNTDPLLGPLANNGGPTLTHLPAADSPARESIPVGTVGLCDGTVPTDQRGVARPQGAACDRGSVEQ
jgi:hypothetical protein